MTLLDSSAWAFSDDPGSGTAGTVFDAAKMAALKASIEALVHSSTNPTVTPQAIIDEVVAARGSKSSVDARLDVFFNEDGTPKSSALTGIAPSVGEFKSILGNQNLSPNPEFDAWFNGTTSAPDGFIKVGAGSTVQRVGVGEADTTNLGTGGWSARLTRSGTDCYLEWDGYGTLASITRLRGRKFSVGVVIKASAASQAKVTIYDGIGSDSSTFHSGGGAAEWKTVTRTLSGSATTLKVRLEVVTTNGDVYFGGHIFIVSDLAPSDWNPATGPAQNGLTGFINGLVSGYEQNWTGIKNFQTHPTITPGYVSDAERAMASAHWHTNITPVGNVGGGTDDLMSKDLPAFFIGSAYPATITGNAGPEMAVKVTASFSIANNANAKTLTFVFNGVTVATATLRTSTADPAIAVFWIVRTGLNTQRVFGYISHAGGSGASNYQVNVNTTGAATESGAINVKFQGAATSNDDILQTSMVIGHGTL